MGIRVAPSEAASRALTADGLASRLEGIGEERYHHQHPFHLLMHEGRLTPGQLPAWAFNRYCYQSRVPMKDAIVLSRSEDPGVRRAWRKRLVDQDGHANAGGLECWVQLAEATGLPRKRVTSCAEVLPAVRYAVDAYLALVERRTLLEAVASSLTELFASRLIAVRLDALRRHYPWLQGGLGYFKARLSQAPRRRALRIRMGVRACPHPRRSRASSAGADLQVRRPVGTTRCVVFCVRGARLASPGRLSTRMTMKVLSHASHPRLGIGCRVRKVENGDSILLLPEGILRLKGTAAEIIRLSNGERTVADILRAMQARYPSSDPEQMEQEIGSFLNRLLERRAVDFQ